MEVAAQEPDGLERKLASTMAEAKVDLGATVEGRFSPDDWQKILARAENELRVGCRAHPEQDVLTSWKEVVRDFHRSRYWGFLPNYKPKRADQPKKPRNLGLQFIWFTFSSLTITKVFVLWYGQIYARSDERSDSLWFFLVLALVAGNYIWFIWRHHRHPDR